jgi:hypothetical protein
MQSVMSSSISADMLAVRHSSATRITSFEGMTQGNQRACKLAKEEAEMLDISSAEHNDNFSIQVLKQMAWFRQGLAKAEQSGLELAELASIRGAIMKSLAELRTLYKVAEGTVLPDKCP